MPHQAKSAVTAAAVLAAAFLPASASAASTRATPAPSNFAVTIQARSGPAVLTAHGYADPARKAADLTTQFPSWPDAEIRLIGGKVYLHLSPGTPWLIITPAALGVPPALLWSTGASTRHLTVTMGSALPVTVTITLTPATAKPIRPPANAVHLTGYANGLRMLAR